MSPKIGFWFKLREVKGGAPFLLCRALIQYLSPFRGHDKQESPQVGSKHVHNSMVAATAEGISAPDLSPKFHPAGGRIRSSLLRPRTLDHPGLEFPGSVMMAGWMCHHEQAM